MSYPPPSNEASVARVVAQIEALRNDLQTFIAGMDRRLERIEVQTTATNGRVRDLEAFRIRVEATDAAHAEHTDDEDAEERERRERRMRWLLAGFAIVGAVISGVTVALVTAAFLPA